jgi:transposase
MWTLCRAQGRLKAQGRQCTDSTPGLAALQPLKRRECVGATQRYARHVLATAALAWLQAWGLAEWFERYRRRLAEYRRPPARPARSVLAEQIGTAGCQGLWGIDEPATPAWLREMPAIETLRQGGLQQGSAPPAGQPVCGRCAAELPPAPRLLSAPYAPVTRYGTKRETKWTGYKVHVTATWDAATPTLSTEVTTTPATTSEVAGLPTMQAPLVTRQLPRGTSWAMRAR